MAGHAETRARLVTSAGAPREREDEVRLSLPARPENVPIIRHVLAAFAETLALPDRLVEDIRLAVTEAATNVVRHAYDSGGGTIDVRMRPEGGAVCLVVADQGRGLGPSPDTSGPGLGLPLIAALADDLEIDQGAGGGSRVAMTFVRSRADAA